MFDRWSARRLDDLGVDYLGLDAPMFKMHLGAWAEPVLAALGITASGAPVFVALVPVTGESTEVWGDFMDETDQAWAGARRCSVMAPLG